MAQNKSTATLVLSLLGTAGLLGVGVWWWGQQSPVSQPSEPASSAIVSTNVSLGQVEKRLSLGGQTLIPANTNAEKQAGMKAFAAGDWATASQKLQAALQIQRDDPEAWIYLNNAKALNQASTAGGKTIQIGVSVPTGGSFVPIGGNSAPIVSSFDTAQEILRGVAQAQDEVNQRGGVNGALVQVMIANDSNDPAIAQQIARAFVQNDKILAVVGHVANEVSIAAAPIYQTGRLVMVSPTSQAKRLSNMGNYIFRTTPSARFVAGILARHNLKNLNAKKLAICFDSRAEISQTLKAEMISAITADRGSVSAINCDFAAADFDAPLIMRQILDDGADSLLLAASVDRFTGAIEMAQANRGRLPMLGSPALYATRTLELGKSAVDGLVLAVNWHPDASSDNAFVTAAKDRWGDQFTWRTALAYDSTQAILTGLQPEASRTGLEKALANERFAATGATGTIQFLPSGDRNGAAFLVKIQPGRRSGEGYDFVLLK
jgi:branched-chain amino acid transport system substrate-binding protein